MVGLVERMLALHQKLAAATIPADKKLYQRQIEAADRQIDALVYELTEEETRSSRSQTTLPNDDDVDRVKEVFPWVGTGSSRPRA